MRRLFLPKKPYKNPLDNQHWNIEDYKQRVTTKQWKQILLHKDDLFIAQGRSRQLIAKNLGAGVWEIYKAPQGEKK